MQNQVYAAQASAIADAGLEDAFSRVRADSSWDGPIQGRPFGGGSYSVTVAGSLPNLTVASTGTSSQGFVARIEADVTVKSSAPHTIRVDDLRINE